MLTRLVDYLKSEGVTAMFTSLTNGANRDRELTDVGISSLMDTWILLRDLELNGERNRAIYILKSRGMKHSNQVREFLLTSQGIDLADVYIGPGGVLTGSARAKQEAVDTAEKLLLQQTMEKRLRDLDRKRKLLDAQILALQAEFEAEESEVGHIVSQERLKERVMEKNRNVQARSRLADASAHASTNGGSR
jgi:circadian clock protein KaiC